MKIHSITDDMIDDIKNSITTILRRTDDQIIIDQIKHLFEVCEYLRSEKGMNTFNVLNIIDGKRSDRENTLKKLTSCINEYDRGFIEGQECAFQELKDWIEDLRKINDGDQK